VSDSHHGIAATIEHDAESRESCFLPVNGTFANKTGEKSRNAAQRQVNGPIPDARASTTARHLDGQAGNALERHVQ